MKIVVGVDGSAASREALRYALDEAALWDAALRIVGAWQPPVYPVDGVFIGTDIVFSSPQEAARERIVEMLDEVRQPDHPEPIIETPSGSAAGRLLEASEHADLLVLGSRGHGRFIGALTGSVTHQVANHTHCPLLVVPTSADGAAPSAPAPNVIVVGVDGSATSIAALDWSLRRAARSGATVRAVLTWLDDHIEWMPSIAEATAPSDSEAESTARRSLEHIVSMAEVPEGVTVEAVVDKGATIDVLNALADDAAMVVVGARGQGGFLGLLLGSVAAQVLRHVERPTVIIPVGDH